MKTPRNSDIFYRLKRRAERMCEAAIEAARVLCDDIDNLLAFAKQKRASIRSVALIATTPNHHQRQFMQRFRDAGRVKTTALPDSPKLIARLVSKGWIEKLQTPSGPACASLKKACRRRRHL